MPALNDTVVRQLYEAAAGLLPWSDALGGLFQVMRVRQMQLLAVDKMTGSLIRSDQPACMDSIVFDAILEYLREYHRCDPHAQYAAAAPIGAVINTALQFPREQYQDHPFYREYWSAYGVRELLAAKVAEDDRYIVMLGMSRMDEATPFSAGDMLKFGRYVAHLVAAYNIVRHLGVEQATAQAGLALIEASSRPMILIEGNLRVLASNSLARQYVSAQSILYQDGAVLRCRSAQATTELQRGLSEIGVISVSKDHQTHKRRVALRLDSSNHSEPALRCSLWAMQPATSMSAFGPTSVALLTIAPSRTNGLSDPVFISSMFDLTPAEARIAAALLEGRELLEIARIYAVSRETIRSQLKSIFLKTGTRRQADLVALLLQVLQT